MKHQYFLVVLSLNLLFCGEHLFGQTNQTERLYFPFLDKESQSNVVVNISDFFGDGQSCPPKLTNVLSNTNLFTPKEQDLIKEIVVKYKNITTNSGPSGTVLVSFYRTNLVSMSMNRKVNVENWVANYQYTNREAHEEISFGAGMLAKFRDKSDDGYDVSFTRTGDGTLMNFLEIKHGSPNGMLARFADGYPQGLTWDYNLFNFTNNRVAEYSQYTNGMVLGRYLIWNPRSGRLVVDAEFKEPYDMKKHRTDFRSLPGH